MAEQIFYGSNRILKVAGHQTGEAKTRHRFKDRYALPPGKRISKSGKVYYEYRKNRSDLPGAP